MPERAIQVELLGGPADGLYVYVLKDRPAGVLYVRPGKMECVTATAYLKGDAVYSLRDDGRYRHVGPAMDDSPYRNR